MRNSDPLFDGYLNLSSGEQVQPGRCLADASITVCTSEIEWVLLECRYNCTKAVLIGTTTTLFPIFDIPVFWPILLLYWLVLLFITMRRQIRHMIKYRYIPFSTGKKVGGVSSITCTQEAKQHSLVAFAALHRLGVQATCQVGLAPLVTVTAADST